MFFTTLLLAEPVSIRIKAGRTDAAVSMTPRSPIFTGRPPFAEDVLLYLEVEVMPEDDIWDLDVLVFIEDSEDEDSIFLVSQERVAVHGHRTDPTTITQVIQTHIEFDKPGRYRLRAFAGQADSENYAEAPWKWLFVA